jgi:drug/metabolite transporter (DMT)-like permease
MATAMTRPLLAVAMVTGAMALFGLIDNFMALAAETGGLWQFHAVRGALAVALVLPVAVWLGGGLRPRSWAAVLSRSALNGGAMLIYFGCLGFMPIAEVAAGLFTAPLWVVIFSALIWRDPVGPWRISAVLLGFLGILLVLRPEAGTLSPWSLAPVVAGALYGMGNLITRKWCAAENTLTMLALFFGLLGVIGAVGTLVLWIAPQPVAPGGDGFLTRGWMPLQGPFLWVIVAQAVGSLIGVGLSIRAYQMADPALVAVCENTLLVFATLWAVVLWGQVPDVPALAGIALIVAAGAIIAIRSARAPRIEARPAS